MSPLPLVRRQRRCFRCLKMYHITQNCNSKIRCSVCNGKHHVTICKGKSQEPAAGDAKGKDSDQYTHVGAAHMTKRGTGILLPSAMVMSVMICLVGFLFTTLVVVCDWSQYESVARTCRTVVHIRGQAILANICCCSMSHKFRLVKLCGSCRGDNVLKMIFQMRGQVAATGFRYTCPQHIPSIAKNVILLPLHVHETDTHVLSFCVWRPLYALECFISFGIWFF